MLSLGIAGGCLAVLIVAARITPNPAGLGTHLRLGLQQCQFLVRTGLPCPSCGMTTSFAYFAHGNLLASFYVQPAGLVLAILTTAAFWIGLYIAATGMPVHRMLRMLPATTLMLTMFAVGLGAWAWKIFAHLRGIDGWGS